MFTSAAKAALIAEIKCRAEALLHPRTEWLELEWLKLEWLELK